MNKLKLPFLNFGRSHRKAKLLVHLSLKNLLSKRLRSMLTIAGVTIGIGSIFLLLSLGLGLQQLVRERIVGGNTMNAVTVSPASSKIIRLDEENITKLSQIPAVEEVGKTYSQASRVSLNNANTDAALYGVDIVALRLNNLQISSGRMLDVNNSDEIIVNTALLEKIGITEAIDGIGKKIELKFATIAEANEASASFTIVGVIGSTVGSEIFVTEKVFHSLDDVYPTNVKLVVKNQNAVANVRAAAEAAGFTTISPLDTLEQINQVFGIFNFVLVGFGSIGMVIAILGMFNTLTISLLERTREIGLMVALGARQRDMRLLFVSEALIISVLGSTIGMAGAVSLGFIVDSVFNRISASRGVGIENFSLFSEPLWLLASGLLFAVVLGYAVVYVPAKHAASINPIDALRRE